MRPAGAILAHTRTGRPLGADPFVEELEQRLDRPLKHNKPGPKPKQSDTARIDLFSVTNPD
jgi:hypothetical protein